MCMVFEVSELFPYYGLHIRICIYTYALIHLSRYGNMCWMPISSQFEENYCLWCMVGTRSLMHSSRRNTRCKLRTTCTLPRGQCMLTLCSKVSMWYLYKSLQRRDVRYRSLKLMWYEWFDVLWGDVYMSMRCDLRDDMMWYITSVLPRTPSFATLTVLILGGDDCGEHMCNISIVALM